MFTAYEQKHGALPGPGIEPTADQLSALSQLLSTDAVPNADFAHWTPYGRRFLARLVLVAFVLNPEGKWARTELPGPPDFDHWWSSWRVLRAAFFLLAAVDPEHLDVYAEKIRGWSAEYPGCWFIIYTADCRMRAEEFERIRRAAEQRHQRRTQEGRDSDFDPNRPWNRVFANASAPISAPWWDETLKDNALLYLNNIQSAAQAVDDKTAHGVGCEEPRQVRARPPPPKRLKASEAAPPPPKAAQPGLPEDLSRRTPEGTYTHNRCGHKICPQFAAGGCGKPGAACPLGVHQCPRCLGTHDPKQPCSQAGKGKGKRGKGRR